MARDTRERILDIGLDRFAHHGLAATTVKDIEREAGLRAGSGSFYRHFSSKDELFFAVVERELERLQQAFEDSIRADSLTGDARGIVALECRRVLNAMEERHQLTSIIVRDHDALGPLIDRVHKTISAGVEINADLVAMLMERGMIPRREPRHVAAVVTNALVGYHGSARYLHESPGRVPVDAYIATLVDFVVT